MSRLKLQGLTRIVPWAQDLLGEVLWPGALAVDLTAGNGHDTLFLWRQVGPAGRVLAFDVQSQALANTADRLRSAGAPVVSHERSAVIEKENTGVHLIHDCHAHLNRYLCDAPAGAIANLGYLPGADREVITRWKITRMALSQSLDLIAEGGRLAVVAYPGHPGGEEEAGGVADFMQSLDSCSWEVLHLRADNRPTGPLLWVAQKKG